jgi:hypothetical protein
MVAVYAEDGTICCHEPPFTDDEERAINRMMDITGGLTILHGPPAQAHAPKPQSPPATPQPPAEK